jgi:hypothetical protein
VQPGCGLSGYAFLVPTTVLGDSQSQVDDLRHNQIEPADRTRAAQRLERRSRQQRACRDSRWTSKATPLARRRTYETRVSRTLQRPPLVRP